MDLNKAVEVLNRERHREFGDWFINDAPPDTEFVVSGKMTSGTHSFEYLTAFEAIAIAREYECAGMTLERAVEVLNEENYGKQHLPWKTLAEGIAVGAGSEGWMHPFAAIAVAQKLLREKGANNAPEA